MPSNIKRFIFIALLALFISALALVSILILSVSINPKNVPEVDHYFETDGTTITTKYNRMVKQGFSEQKDDNTFRIFVLGGSQAMGTPYVHQDVALKFKLPGLPEGGGLSTWLKEYFTVLLPEKKVEVVNAAVGGEDIQTTARVYREILQIGQPDLMIILSGNNEYFRHYKNESSYPDSHAAFLEKLQLLTASYKNSLFTIFTLSDSFAIQTYVLTVPTNLRDWYPMSTGNFDENKYKSLMKGQKFQEIIDQINIEDGAPHAIRYFYIAKAYDKLGYQQKALSYYLLAKDYDYRFLRAHSTFNEIIRALPYSNFIHIIDMEYLLGVYSDNGVPGFDHFHDWCHMKLETNELVAKKISEYFKNKNEISIQLPDILISDSYKRRMQLLYYIKKLKWLRLKLFSKSETLGKENIENVQDQYQ